MKIGILVPLSQEMKPFTRKTFLEGEVYQVSHTILVCQSGVGRNKTLSAARQLNQYDIQHIISWGTAAGLAKAASSGCLLLPESIQVSGKKYFTDANFNHRLGQRISGIKVRTGPMVESETLLETVESKKQLFDASGCIGADMESGAVAEFCSNNQITFSVVRSVSDPADLQLPKAVRSGFKREGKFNMGNFIKAALASPGEWHLIVKLALNFRKAQKTLNIVAKELKNGF